MQPGLTQRDMWVMHSPLEVGMFGVGRVLPLGAGLGGDTTGFGHDVRLWMTNAPEVCAPSLPGAACTKPQTIHSTRCRHNKWTAPTVHFLPSCLLTSIFYLLSPAFSPAHYPTKKHRIEQIDRSSRDGKRQHNRQYDDQPARWCAAQGTGVDVTNGK